MSDWQLETGDYSPKKFYTKSSDSKGHSDTIWLKVPVSLSSALAAIVQSRAIPEYRTSQDICRDAIVHRLHYLYETGMIKGVESAMRRQMAIETLLEREEWASKFSETVDRVTEHVNMLLRERDPDAEAEAARLVKSIYAEAAGMTDTPYWQKKYTRFLEENFGFLLDRE